MSAGTWNTGSGRDEVTGWDVLAERAAALGVATLILIGFVASYTTVRDLAIRVGDFPGWLAPVVPLSFDVGIIVLSLRVLLAARRGRQARMLRALVLLLSVATVVVNGVAADALAGRLLHAVPSGMFVVCFESVVTSARQGALGTDVPLPDPRFRAARWALAPIATWTTWRAHVLADPDVLARNDEVSAPVKADDDARRSAARPAQPRTPRAPKVPSPTRRNALALELLRQQPQITASALAEHLTNQGHGVSVRTANRVREEARRHLAQTSRPDAHLNDLGDAAQDLS